MDNAIDSESFSTDIGESTRKKFSFLIDQSIARVLNRFRREIPMANMFLKGVVAENLTKAAQEELEPLWQEMIALGVIKEDSQVE